MMHRLLLGSVLPLSLLAAACGPNSKAGPCEVDPPAPECTVVCDPGSTNTCPSGFHCSTSGTCTAVCTPTGGECASGEVCTSDGRCIQGDGDAALGPDADCPDVTFTAMPVTPTVQFVIDKSGSMRSDFGATTRYDAIRQALVGPTGVVTQYQAQVYFGATTYHQDGSNTCPRLASAGAGRALNNLGAIQTLLQTNPSGNSGTPTGPSVESAYQEMLANPPPAGSPPILVVATDGQPFTCPDNDDNAAGQAQSLAAATAAHAAGIPVYVLGVAVDPPTRAHLQQVANVGQGMPAGASPGAMYYGADDPTQLAAAFQAIIGGVVSCDLTLDGSINMGQAAAGTVTLNGNPLNYGSDWTLVGTSTIQLTGAACDALRGSPNPMVSATFPCGAVID